MRPSPRQVGIAVLVLAAATRLAFVAESSDFPLFTNPIPGLDVDLNWRGAQQLRAGAAGPSLELMALSAPFYVHWTALTQAILGDRMLVHRILYALSGALMPWLVFRLAYRETKRLWPAFAVALAVCLLPSVIFMDTRLIKTSIEVILVAVLLFVVPRRRPGLTGVILGLLLMSQIMTVLFWLPIFAYWGKLRPIAKALPGIAVAILLTVWAANGPTPRFLPQGGVEVFLGNHPLSRGYYTRRREIPPSPVGHVFEARIVAEAELGRALTPREANGFYLRKAWKNAVENPFTTVKLWLRKTRLFFNDFEPPSEDYLPRLKEKSWVLSSPFGFGVLVWLSAFGVAAMWTNRRRRTLLLVGGLILAPLAASLLSFVSWRFRLHAVPPLAVLAAVGLKSLVDKWRDRRIVTASIAIAAGLLAFVPVLSSEERASIHRGVTTNERASERARERGDAQANPQLLMASGRHTEALRALEAAVPAPAASYGMNTAYVKYLCWLGEEPKAIAFLDRLLENDPQAYSATLEHIPEPYRVVLKRR